MNKLSLVLLSAVLTAAGATAQPRPGSGGGPGARPGPSERQGAAERVSPHQREELRTFIRDQRGAAPDEDRGHRQLSPQERHLLREQLRQQRREQRNAP